MNNKELGLIGENTAVEMLKAEGYRILKRNYRCKLGEIDIIAFRDGKISFVEVKMRRSDHYGRPCEAVDARKQAHIRRTAVCYLKDLRQKGYVPETVSFDVVEVVARHIECAF